MSTKDGSGGDYGTHCLGMFHSRLAFTDAELQQVSVRAETANGLLRAASVVHRDPGGTATLLVGEKGKLSGGDVQFAFRASLTFV